MTDRFCEHCDVSLDLHPGYTGPGWEADDEWECEAATARAGLIDRFYLIGVRR